MRYIQVRDTNLRPSVIGLGTSDFGTAIREEEAFGLLDRFVELGGTLVDTAHVYGDWVEGGKGASERTIGKWLEQRGSRDKIVLSTKGAHPPLADFARSRLDADSIRSDLSDSLERLRTDWIDLYWLHRDDPERPVEAVMEALHEHVAAGRVHYIGASNWTRERIAAANRYAQRSGLTPFVASQPHWNLAVLNPVLPPDIVAIDDETRAWHVETGLAVFAFSSQASGFFGGKYGRGLAPEGGRAGHVQEMYANEASYDRLERVLALSNRLGTRASQTALAYVLSHPFPAFALIGANKLEHLEDSCKAGDLVLTPEQLRYLESGEGSFTSAVSPKD
ncbi:aldo/keto reductase [Cohnella fermenti]|nr:aldo/keto reductase [Cohnella fermenti]